MSILRAAIVTPLRGPLAPYGRAAAAGLALWAERAAALPPRWRSIDLDVLDAHPDAAAATRAAAAGLPDLLFGPYGSGPAVAAARATTRLLWNHGGATSRLRRPAFAHVVNVPAPASTYFDGALQLVRRADPAAAHAAILHADTGFGRDVGLGAARAAGQLGFECDVVAIGPGVPVEEWTDVAAGDVLAVAGSFEDERRAAAVLLERRWPAAAFVGAGVEEVLSGLGDAREGLIGPAQWVPWAGPEPDEGPTAGWFEAAYRLANGNDPPYPAALAFVAGVLAARCLREAGEAEDAALRAAAEALRCVTLVGSFRVDPTTGLQVGHGVLTVQWQGGRRRVVWPTERAERPFIYPREDGGRLERF